jgi:hypothetical protein
MTLEHKYVAHTDRNACRDYQRQERHVQYLEECFGRQLPMEQRTYSARMFEEVRDILVRMDCYERQYNASTTITESDKWWQKYHDHRRRLSRFPKKVLEVVQEQRTRGTPWSREQMTQAAQKAWAQEHDRKQRSQSFTDAWNIVAVHAAHAAHAAHCRP